MAWTIVSKAVAAGLGSVAEGDLQDEWSDMVEDMITDYMGYEYIGETQEIADEAHDGSGTSKLFVKHPPIVSVGKLEIGTSTKSLLSASSYKVYDHYVELVSWPQSRVQEALRGPRNIFPQGEQNVVITYTSGLATVPAKVKLCAATMLAEIAHFSQRGSAQGAIKYRPPERVDGERQPIAQRYGLLGALNMIMQEALDKKEFSIA